ncbi:GIY-YIG nuclease family protein [Maricaulis alexandrii]|uniref:GIY-YIG nuclease family protein n=1 Tax=Maricaulis alexandrii TaxID=2570354 RepID=UPI0038994779
MNIHGLDADRELLAPSNETVAYIGVATNLRERCWTHFNGSAKASGFRVSAWSLFRSLGLAPCLEYQAAERWLTGFLSKNASLIWADCTYPRSVEAFLLKRYDFTCNIQGQKGRVKDLLVQAKRRFAQEISQ